MAISVRTASLLFLVLLLRACVGDDSDEIDEGCVSPTSEVITCTTIMSYPDSDMCTAADRYVACMEQVQEQCQGHPQMARLPVQQSIDYANGLISENCTPGGGDCQSVVDRLMSCSSFMSGPRSDICTSLTEHVNCLEDVQERCADNPQLASIPVQDSIDSAYSMMEQLCEQQVPGPSTTQTPTASSSSSEEEEDPEENTVVGPVRVCTGRKSKFEHKLRTCFEPLNSSLTGQILCRAFSKVLTCAEKLVSSCRDRDWMTEELINEIQDSMARLREIQTRYECRLL